MIWVILTLMRLFLVFVALFIAPLFIAPLLPATETLPDISYFKESFEECDKDFNQQFYRIKKNRPEAEIHEFQYSEGSIKSYFFPATKVQKNLLVMISGTHGIEGFTGSAVQRWLLDQKIDDEKTAILMIHGFNLYGFKNFRRVNENNIDLNRNFILSRGQFKVDDKSYAELDSLLNPKSPPEVNFYSRYSFILKSVFNIAKYSLESLRSSILKGQYSFPNGVFYGGNKTQIQGMLITDLVQTYMKPYKKILLIDLHTGYGERAKLHLLAGKASDGNSIILQKIFNADEIDFSDKNKFYAVEGEMLAYFANKIKLKVNAELAAVVFEYGTLDTQKTLGSIESLRRVVLENQNFHFPAAPDTSRKIKTLYREMFYPSDKNWRRAVLQQTSEKMTAILRYLD